MSIKQNRKKIMKSSIVNMFALLSLSHRSLSCHFSQNILYIRPIFSLVQFNSYIWCANVIKHMFGHVAIATSCLWKYDNTVVRHQLLHHSNRVLVDSSAGGPTHRAHTGERKKISQVNLSTHSNYLFEGNVIEMYIYSYLLIPLWNKLQNRLKFNIKEERDQHDQRTNEPVSMCLHGR